MMIAVAVFVGVALCVFVLLWAMDKGQR